MRNEDRVKIYPATSLQKGMVYNSLANPNSGVEIEQIIFTLNEKINIEAFNNAWETVIGRHDISRTSFQWANTEIILQVVKPEVFLQHEYFDWNGIFDNKKENDFNAYIKKDRLNDFDLNKAPLMRLTIIRLDDSLYKVIWTFHHALMDGRSFPIIIEELFKYYDAYCNGIDLSLVEASQFGEYAVWLSSKDLNEDEKYWKEELEGFDKPNSIPILTAINSNESGYARQEKKLSETLSNSLRTFSKEKNFSVNTMIQGAWSKLLYHYTGDEDLIFGTTWSCRYADFEGVQSMAGLLINTLPMRIGITKNKTVLQLLKEIRERNIKMRKHLFAPLNEIHKWSKIKAGSSLFESLVVFENYLLDSLLRNKGKMWEKRKFEYVGQTNYPVTLACYNDKEILLRIEYYKNRFDKDAINRMLDHIETILHNFEKNPIIPVMEVPYLTEREMKQLLVEWNNTKTEYPRDASISELFEEQVKAQPNEPAVSFMGKTLSYSELNEKANILADKLVSFGVKPEGKVAFCIDRSIELIVVIVSILKAGGAYVPLDPEYPRERLDYMIADVDASILIIQKKWEERVRSNKVQVVYVEDLYGSESQIGENVVSGVNADNLAYIMYTSGSTGRPKGIEVTHRNVVRLVKNTNFANLSNKEVFLLYAPVSFDASTLEIWGALLNGGKIAICPPGQLSPKELGEIIKTNKVTLLWLTAGLFHNIVEHDIECLSSIKQLLSGGDVLSPSVVLKVLSEIDDVCMINGYGPTENTTFTCCYPMKKGTRIGKTVPIGRPISNTKVYILDKHMKPVPIGIPGELYTAGDGLARGYLNRPELTQQVFLPELFSESKNSMMYKTGDLVRYLPDGNIEFWGRIDNQVKLRGYRIELGEIEAVISKYSDVSQVATIVRNDNQGSKTLVAYFTSKDDKINIENELRKYLENKLPQYMIPQFFIKLDKFPLTANGKIDRNDLPSPKDVVTGKKEYKEPSNELERQIVEIWKKIIGVGKISVDDKFNEVGGDSLMAVILFFELERLTGKNMPLSTLLRAPTVRELAVEFGNQGKNKGKETDVINAVRRENVDKQIWSSLVEIKKTGRQRPFFCFHAAGGNVLNYLQIASHLDVDQPMYGIQSIGLDGRTKPIRRLEEMASYYKNEIKSIQPHGPYLLGGGSMGGMIAFEVAQQLKRDGDKIILLVMFDTLGPNYKHYTLNGEVKGVMNKLKLYWDSITSKGHIEKVQFIGAKIISVIVSRMKGLICSIYYLLNIPIPHNIRYWYIEQVNIRALLNYTPKFYDGEITIITGSIEENGVFNDPKRGWENVALGGIKVFNIAGEHEKLVEKTELSQIVSNLLKEQTKLHSNDHQRHYTTLSV